MTNLKTVAIIPARLESTRLPGKLLLDLNGKYLLQRVYDNVKLFDFFDDIYIATDSDEIIQVCSELNFKYIKTNKNHISGTSRIAEAAVQIEADIIVNIQGDEPFIEKKQIQDLINGIKQTPQASIATLFFQSSDYEDAIDPNIVKIVKDHNNFALYFSRLAIPYNRALPDSGNWFHHIGVYAYKKDFLLKFNLLSDCILEQTEKLEQLKFLSNGYKIILVETDKKTLGIDTEQDLIKAKEFLENG